MSDKRTVFEIPENEWVKVVNGLKNAKIVRSEIGPSYFSMAYDSITDIPTNGILYDTAEKMFESGNEMIVEDLNEVYVWVSCAKDQAGRVIVTI